jgi:hypothetical protein
LIDLELVAIESPPDVVIEVEASPSLRLAALFEDHPILRDALKDVPRIQMSAQDAEFAGLRAYRALPRIAREVAVIAERLQARRP